MLLQPNLIDRLKDKIDRAPKNKITKREDFLGGWKYDVNGLPIGRKLYWEDNLQDRLSRKLQGELFEEQKAKSRNVEALNRDYRRFMSQGLWTRDAGGVHHPVAGAQLKNYDELRASLGEPLFIRIGPAGAYRYFEPDQTLLNQATMVRGLPLPFSNENTVRRLKRNVMKINNLRDLYDRMAKSNKPKIKK